MFSVHFNKHPRGLLITASYVAEGSPTLTLSRHVETEDKDDKSVHDFIAEAKEEFTSRGAVITETEIATDGEN